MELPSKIDLEQQRTNFFFRFFFSKSYFFPLVLFPFFLYFQFIVFFKNIQTYSFISIIKLSNTMFNIQKLNRISNIFCKQSKNLKLVGENKINNATQFKYNRFSTQLTRKWIISEHYIKSWLLFCFESNSIVFWNKQRVNVENSSIQILFLCTFFTSYELYFNSSMLLYIDSNF